MFYADASNQEPAPDDVLNYKVVVGLCAAVSLICSIDRASISVAIVPMAEQFGWSDSAKGAISSSFFLGYTVTNLIGEVNTARRTHCAICCSMQATSVVATLYPECNPRCNLTLWSKWASHVSLVPLGACS